MAAAVVAISFDYSAGYSLYCALQYSTIGDNVFLVVAVREGNSHPQLATLSPSFTVMRRR